MNVSCPLHVVFLVGSLTQGGLEWMVVQLARSIRSTCRVSVICFDESGELEAHLTEVDIPVEVLPRRPGVDVRYPFRLASRLQALGSHVVHVHNDTALFYGGLAAFLAGRALVYTEHDRILPERRSVRLINFLLASSARRVVTVSEELRRLLVDGEGIAASRIQVVPNGVDLASPRDPGGTRLRERERIPGHARLVGVVAGLRPEKNHALLLESAARLRIRFPQLHLVFVGDGPLLPDLQAHARRLGMEDRTRFLGFRSDLPEVYAALDVVALTSDTEGMPLTLLEAMAAGKPVVASRVGGVPEVVEHERTGLLFAPGDGAALDQALAFLLTRPDACRAMGEAGRCRYETHFTLRRMARAYATIYRSVTEEA